MTPDMTVRQVREVKRQARREKGRAEDKAVPQQPEAVEVEAVLPSSPRCFLISSGDFVTSEASSQGSAPLHERVEGGREEEAFPAKDEVPDAEYRELFLLMASNLHAMV